MNVFAVISIINIEKYVKYWILGYISIFVNTDRIILHPSYIPLVSITWRTPILARRATLIVTEIQLP